MNLHYISNYDYLVNALVFGASKFKPSLYYDDHGNASIGFNFNLNDPLTFRRILTYLQFDVDGKFLPESAQVAERYYMQLLQFALSSHNGGNAHALNTVVQKILSARHLDTRYANVKDFARLTEFRINSQKDSVGLGFELIKTYETVVDNWITAHDFDILKSNSHLLSRSTRERAVLVSLAAQHIIGFDEEGKPKASALAQALIDDHRPRIWHFIRYALTANGATETETMRHLYEAELFGVYDEGVTQNTISRTYCKKLYDMYNEHKKDIMVFERDNGYLISKANLNYRLTPPDHIKTLEQSFSIAYNHIRSAPTIHLTKESAVNYMESHMNDLVDFWAVHGKKELEHEIAV